MRFRWRIGRTSWVAALGLAVACGSDSTGPDPDPTPDPSNSSMSARIDGQPWTANVGIQAVRASGAIGLAGGNGDVIISLGFVGSGPGTFTIGGPSGANGTVSESNGTVAWTTSAGGGSGSIVVTTLDDTRVAGTFSFVAPASAATSATGTRTVTEGTFNVRF